MAKLYFKFGAVGSSKTAQALMTKFNYEEKEKKVWLIKPAAAHRDDRVDVFGDLTTTVKSGIGLNAIAEAIRREDNLVEKFESRRAKRNADVIICDDCQFLTAAQVEQLKEIVDRFEIPVLCFGLRSDGGTRLFEGSRRLFEIADSISEVKSICVCGRKATVNGCFSAEGQLMTESGAVGEKYEGLCYHCYKKLLSKKTEEPV